MTPWTSEELTRVGAAEELEIAFLRGDGTLGRPRTIWVVPYRDGLYIRSVNGPRITPSRAFDQVRLALRLGQRRPPGRSGHGGRSGVRHCSLEGDLGGRAGRQPHRLATHDDLLGPAVGAAES
jgi:hypothetical protein